MNNYYIYIYNDICFLFEPIKLLLIEGKLSQKIIARIFGVSPLTISAIKTGKIWNHIKI